MTAKKPNFLIIMADFMGALVLPPYGNTIAKTPNMARLADDGVVFENAYCNYPLCAPSRASMMASLLPSEIGVHDNGAEFPASIPTFAHYLRDLGYRCELSGKMHFVGPDQLHGFDERLTTDTVPADFGWMPTRELDGDWPNVDPIRESGVAARTLGLDFDEEVSHRAIRRLYDFARDPDLDPFLLTVSYIEPHEPYRTTQECWDRYSDGEIGLPSVPLLDEADWDAHSRRLYELMGIDKNALTDEQIVRARHGFYAMVSYIDQQVGRLLAALDETKLADDTIVIVTADHGAMIGERGMWCIVNFFEWTMRVPFILHAPGRFAPRRVPANVSLVDLFPTLLDLASGGNPPDLATPIEGRSLVPLAQGGAPADDDDTVYAEIAAEGCVKPGAMVKRGSHKFIHCEADPPMLFDLASDPQELNNLADNPAWADVVTSMKAAVDAKWDLQRWEADVEESWHRRRMIYATFEKGNPPVWDYAVDNDPWRHYQRSFREPWQDTEHKATLR
ncbi:MAG: choline-sulfatase [Pseudomonadota bacterium]